MVSHDRPPILILRRYDMHHFPFSYLVTAGPHQAASAMQAGPWLCDFLCVPVLRAVMAQSRHPFKEMNLTFYIY